MIPRGDVLYKRGAPIQWIFFPSGAVISSVAVAATGSTAELASVGREGFVGVAAFLGAPSAPNDEIALVGGPALRVPIDAVIETASKDGRFGARMNQYVQAFTTQVSQTAACNGLHSVESRLARWLLLAHERAGRGDIPATQDIVAAMLATRRASVSIAAHELRQRNVIEFSRGKIHMLDRAALEATACECYTLMRGELEKLLRSF